MKKFIVSLFTLTLFAANMMAQCDVPGTVTATVRLVRKPGTLLKGQFSVAADRKVSFSKGNLQYVASPAGWRFADHQYDIEGSDNAYISSTYADYIDLFGYGTSGESSKNPYEASETASNYATSPIAETNYDWGVKNYTVDVDAGYRVLTAEEWDFLLDGRTNASSLRVPATVNGQEGLILLPDDWVNPGVSLTMSATNYGTNSLTAVNWGTLENAGAVFLPAAGKRSVVSETITVSDVDVTGYYWASTFVNSKASYITISATAVTTKSTTLTAPCGMSVRLVQTL